MQMKHFVVVHVQMTAMLLIKHALMMKKIVQMDVIVKTGLLEIIMEYVLKKIYALVRSISNLINYTSKEIYKNLYREMQQFI